MINSTFLPLKAYPPTYLPIYILPTYLLVGTLYPGPVR